MREDRTMQRKRIWQAAVLMTVLLSGCGYQQAQQARRAAEEAAEAGKTRLALAREEAARRAAEELRARGDADRRRAEEARAEVERAKLRTEAALYAERLALAERAWRDNDAKKAADLLDQLRPEL